MPLSPEQLQRILSAMNEKVPEIGKCQLCGHDDWQIQNGFATVVLSDSPGTIPMRGSGLPSVVVICTTCGNTALVNLYVLGLEDMLPSPPAATPQSAMPQPETIPEATPSEDG